MKRSISLIILAIFLFASCEKQGEPLTVTLEKDTVVISATEKASVGYETRNHNADVSVVCIGIQDVTISNIFDPSTGKGEIIFATGSTRPCKETGILRFHDGKDSVEKEMSVVIDSSWSVVPGTPTQGE